MYTVTETSQFPTFWNEDWLKKAISELDIRNMTPEQKIAYEMAISANAIAVKNENKKIKEVEERKTKEFVENSFEQGLDVFLIAKLANISVNFVLEVQK